MPTIYFTGSASDNFAFKANSVVSYPLTASGVLPENCKILEATFSLSKVYSYSDYYSFDVDNANGDNLGRDFCGDGSSKSTNVAESFTWSLRTDIDIDRYRHLDTITLEGNGSTTANLMSIRSGCEIEIAVTYEEYVKPTLDTNYPANVSVAPGTSTTLQVKVTSAGYPTSLSYQWYKNDSKISGANSAMLTVTPSANTEMYYCVVSNSAGSATSRTATVKRYYTPTLDSRYPADVSFVPGTSVTLSAVISSAGDPASYTYQWYMNGSAISGATGSSLTVSSEGTYYCKVINAAGSVNTRTATIARSSGGAIWVNGTKKPATVYVYHNGMFRVATPYCYSNGQYRPCSSG